MLDLLLNKGRQLHVLLVFQLDVGCLWGIGLGGLLNTFLGIWGLLLDRIVTCVFNGFLLNLSLKLFSAY